MDSLKNAKDVNGKPIHALMMIITLLVGTFTTVLNQTILSTAYPTLMNTFNISTSTVQWLTTGFMLVNGIMIPVTAFLVNKVPTKWLYIFAMSTFLIGTIVAYIAGNFGVLLVGRLIQAVGVGVTMPLLQNIMLTVFPPDKRGTAMGIAGIAIGVAPAIGPTLSGWVIDQFGWRMLFGMIIPVAALVLIGSFFFMANVLPDRDPKLDVLSLIESTIGFGALLYGFSEVGDKGWGSPIVYGTIIIGVLVIALFSYRQLHLEHPFLELRVFKTKIFTLSSILGSIANMAMVGAEMVIPMYLQIIHGKSALESGLTLLPGAIMMALMSPVTGSIFDRIGAKRLAQLGLFLLAVATIPYAFVTASTPSIYITILYMVRMFGVSMTMMPLTTNGMNALPQNMIAHGTAVNNTVRQIASSIATAIMISVLSDVTNATKPGKALLTSDPLAYKHAFFNATLNGYHAAFWFAIGFSTLGWLLAFFLNTKTTATKADVKPAEVKEAVK